jgi:hypothetical protein
MQEVNMIDINNNNQLAKPMVKNTDYIYSANSNPQNGENPYAIQNGYT